MGKSIIVAVAATTLAATLSFGDSFEEEIERVEQRAEVLLTKIKGTVKDSAEYRALVEEFRELLKPREISGTKTLEEVFRDWHFAKVYEVADDGLAFRFRRDTRMVWTSRHEPHMNRTRIRPESVTIVRKGETEGFGSEMQGVTVGFESELFPVEGCSWLTNSTRKVYLRLSRHHEFSRLSMVDRFVVALDLQKAYSVERKQDVPCPIPFVNDEPDITEEECALNNFKSGYGFTYVEKYLVSAVEPLAKVLSLGFSEMVRTNDCALTVKFRDKDAEFLHLTHVRSNGALVSSPVVPGSSSVVSTNELMIVAGPDTTLSLRILPREELMKSCSALVSNGGPWFVEVVFEPEELPPRLPFDCSVQPPSQKFLIDLRDGTSYSLQDGSDTKGFLPFRQTSISK